MKLDCISIRLCILMAFVKNIFKSVSISSLTIYFLWKAKHLENLLLFVLFMFQVNAILFLYYFY